MTNREKVLWITRTAIFIALLVVFQGVSKPLGQYVTGSLVNLVLVLGVMLGGLWCGIAVAALSPVFAFLVGIGPAMPMVVPFVMLGNAVLVLAWWFIAGRKNTRVEKPNARRLVALVAAAVAKFAVLYVGIVLFAIPVLMKLPEKQAKVLSASFSIPQLVTAGIGGAIAILLLPVLSRALKRPQSA